MLSCVHKKIWFYKAPPSRDDGLNPSLLCSSPHHLLHNAVMTSAPGVVSENMVEGFLCVAGPTTGQVVGGLVSSSRCLGLSVQCASSKLDSSQMKSRKDSVGLLSQV